MSDKGIVLAGEDAAIEARARAAKLPVTVDPAMPLAFDKTLYVEPGTAVPWDLLPAAWHFLERWDVAVPLWRYGVTASDVGTPGERERTQAVIRDLRVLLYAHELLFLRRNEAGEALRAAFLEEQADGGEARLAFLRAFYRIKPRLCVLPRSWLAEVQARSRMPRSGRRGRRSRAQLIEVEIGRGRAVKCAAGDEQRTVERLGRAGRRRHAG